MANKKLSNTYIVHHRGKSAERGCCVYGRYKVGAKHEEEAESLLKEIVGKHAKVKVYYQDKTGLMTRGSIVKES